MITAIIVDDDIRCRKALNELLKLSGKKVKILAECGSADEAKEAINSQYPDIVFLDVEMPEKNGFDLLDELEEINFDIVFTTAYEQYAIRAIRSSALDFLLKPIAEKDFLEALHRFETKKNKTQTLRQVEVLLENYSQYNEPNKKIAVPTNNGLEFIRTDNIMRLEADSSYTTFFLSDKTKLVVAKTLKEMEELLSPTKFYRVHHSHLVNIDFIKRFQKSDGGMLIMEDKTEVPISRQRKEELMEILKK
jgi:two-component system, LytTR family, response regulator